ncbi:MAG TPA: hypothetical protein VD978_06160 [Azospirillum sp.]|nr:hypothetical protein [Azospirillum sp.]
MVQFVSYEKAIAISRREPVVFAEVFADNDRYCSLEVHVEVPHEGRMREVERNDTGPISHDEVQALVVRTANRYQANFATICAAQANWPPSSDAGGNRQRS